MERVVVAGTRVEATFRVDFSTMDERGGNPSKLPAFPKFTQEFKLVLESGKQMIVAASNDVVDGVATSQTVTVVATILK